MGNFFQSNTPINYQKFALDPATGELVKRQWRRSLNGFVLDVVDPVELPQPHSAERNIAHTLTAVGKEKVLHALKQTHETLQLEGAIGIDRAIVDLVFREHKEQESTTNFEEQLCQLSILALPE